MQLRDTASGRSLIVPAARVENLVITASRDEVLVYDQDRHHIHHLNPTASAVWALCDGRRTLADLVQASGFEEDAVRLALRKLADANLLAGDLDTGIRGTTQSRRLFMKKAGIAAIPAIVSITAPIAKAAASGCVSSKNGCTYVGQCCNVTQQCIGNYNPQQKLTGYTCG